MAISQLQERIEAYLRDTMREAAFDEEYPDGTMYCSDSNRAVNVREMSTRVITLLKTWAVE